MSSRSEKFPPVCANDDVRKYFVAKGLTADKSVVIERMQKRGDPEEKIQSRLENDAKMFAGYKELCDILIPADTVYETALAIHNYIKKEEK